jgi:hypothetical protein
MTIYTLANILTGLFESIMMYLLLETFCKKRETLPDWIYICSIILSTMLVNLSNSIFNYGLLNAIIMTISFFAMFLLFKGKISIRAILSVLTFLLIGIIEIMVLFGMTLLLNATVAEITTNPSFRLMGIISSKMLTFFIVNIIRIRFKTNNIYKGTSYWLLFFLIFTTSILTVFLVFRLSYDMKVTYLHNLTVVCSFGLLFSTFFTLYLYERLAKQAEDIKIQQQYEQHLKTQLKHLDDILITQNQIKKFKHDFSHYIIGLQAYLEKHDCSGALNHIKDLKKRFSSGEAIVETGNTALDAILSTKKALAESRNIRFITKIQIPEQLSIDSVDMCIVFGNALDNAIEACDKVNDLDKEISLTIICQDKALFCRITNTAPPASKSVFKTTKADKDNHGYGLKNIKNALAKYNSTPTIEHNGNEFTLKFVIFTK